MPNIIPLIPIGPTESDLVSQGNTILRGEVQSIHLDLNHDGPVQIDAVDRDGAAIDMSTMTLRMLVEDHRGADVLIVEDGEILRSLGEIEVDIPDSTTSKKRTLRWSLLDITGDNQVELAAGYFPIY